MKEKTLLRVALISAIIGVSVLFIISDNIEIDEKTIDKINKDNIGEKVKIKGIVTKVSDTNKTLFLEISQPESMTLIVFKDDKEINISSGDYIEVIGKIDEYKGEMEVIVDKIRKIK